MSHTTRVVHEVPLKIKLDGLQAKFICDDPRARIVDDVLYFEFNPPNPKDPPASRRVCFVVEDLPDADGYDNYFNISSGPPLERLVAWERDGTTSRSPEMLPGHKFDVIAIAYSVPGTGTLPGALIQVRSARTRFDISSSGAGGDDLY